MLQGCGTATTPSVPPLPADATEPTLSILLPLDAELREPPRAAIPLLCHLYDAPKGWDTVRWHHGNVSPVMATSMDGRGVLSAWSLTWLTAEQWDGTVGCTAVQSSTGRTITVTIRQPSSTGQLPLLCSIPCLHGCNGGYRGCSFAPCSSHPGMRGCNRSEPPKLPSHCFSSALCSKIHPLKDVGRALSPSFPLPADPSPYQPIPPQFCQLFPIGCALETPFPHLLTSPCAEIPQCRTIG